MPRSPRQERIHRRLRLLGEGPAAFYRDACNIAEGTVSLETGAHLLAHALREIESALRHVLLPVNFVAPEPCGACANVPQKHRAEVLAILEAYEFTEDDDDAVFSSWLRLCGKDDLSLAGLAHRSRLGEPRDLSDATAELWALTESFLDALLDRFESRFAGHLPFVAELLQKEQPGKKDVSALLTRVPNNEVVADYFFGQASAKWLEPLRKAHVFASPPSSRRTDDGVERFPVWYPSKFLARLAQSEQDRAVLRNIGEIALELAVTDNPWVRYDVAVVLQHCPSDLAARIVSFVDGWLSSSSLLRLPEQLGLLSVRLLEAGRLDEGAALITALLETVADARPGPYGEVEVYVRYDAFEFAQFVRSVLPRAGIVGGLPLLRTLCDSLEKAVRLTLAGTGATDDGCAFRPAIEDHRQNRTVLDRTLSLLIEAVRDAADRLTTSDASVLPQLVTELERHEPLVFRRLALYVLHRHPEADRASVARYLLAATDLERVEVWHERRLLERSGFPHLTTAEQEEFLAPIWSGPGDVATVDLRGAPLPDSEIERRRAQWRVHHLVMVADSLSGAQRDEYDRLFAINGEPSHPEFLTYIGEVWTGPTSPRSEGELAALDVTEVAGYLASWAPSGEWMSPSREGVGRTLTKVVSQDPQRFLAQWATFKPVHQTYVRAIVQGISDALLAGKTFSWMEALSLCAWILARPADAAASGTDEPTEDQEPIDNQDRDWNATVSAVAWFLRTAMQTRQDAPSPLLPREHHETVWRLIVELVEWPDANDRGWGGAFDQALNTLHGSSMHTALVFALWRITTLRGSTAPAPGGFAMMPEVATLLERHLDPGVESVACDARALRAFLVAVDCGRPRLGEGPRRSVLPGRRGSEVGAGSNVDHVRRAHATVLVDARDCAGRTPPIAGHARREDGERPGAATAGRCARWSRGWLLLARRNPP